eukprot:s1235_g5.t1
MAPGTARQCQIQAKEDFHLERMEERKGSASIPWQQKDAASLAMTRPSFQPLAAGLSSDRRPGERHEIDQVNRRRSPARRKVEAGAQEASPPGEPQKQGYWKALSTMQPKACDISSVSRKRHEHAISYGFSPASPPAAPSAQSVPSPRAAPHDAGRREEYFETSQSAVQFSPDCTFHYEVMEHRRDARDFAKTLGRPSGTGLRAPRTTRPRSAEGTASQGSLRWEPGLRQRVKPGLPEAARGTVRSPSPKGKGRSTVDEMIEKVEIDPRELMLKDLKCRVDELVKQTTVLHQLHSSPRRATAPAARSPRTRKKTASPSSPGASVSTAAASPLSTSLAPAAQQW